MKSFMQTDDGKESTGEFGPSEGVIYKKSDKKDMELKEGELVCSLCNGWGKVYHKDDDGIFQCPRCKGRGKLDWVENIMGIKVPDGVYGTGVSGFYFKGQFTHGT